MTSRATIGFFAGIVLIALAIAAIPFSADAGAGEPKTDSACALAEVALDEGYGLSRKAVKPVCP